MVLYYTAGFQVTSGSPLDMSCTIAGNAATVAAGTYAHESMATLFGTGVYSQFAAALSTAFTAAGGGPWTVTYSTTTHAYTISRSTNFTLTFTGTPGAQLAQAIGFSTGARSGANSYTSDLRPYYVIVPQELARSQSLPYFYEPDDIVEEDVSDGGTPYAVAKNTTELWSDWMQTMETSAACYDIAATASVPWTWQMFFRHVRGTYPFIVTEDVFSKQYIYKLRADAARFKAEPVVSDWDSLYNIKIRARALGTTT